MEYKKILKKAYQITLKHRLLWLFAIFLGGGASFSGNGGSYGGNGTDGAVSDGIDPFINFVAEYWYLLVLIGFSIVCLILLCILISVVARGAFYEGVRLAKSNKKLKFIALCKFGLGQFWRVLGMTILIGVISVAIVLGLMLPGILLFIIPIIGWILGAMLLVLAVFLLIPVVLAIGVWAHYAYCYLLIDKKKIIDAAQDGCKLLYRNLGESIIMFLLIMLIGFGFAIACLVVIGIIALPFALVGFALYYAWGWASVVVVAGIGILFLVAIMLMLKGAFNTFTYSAWILAWSDLKKKKVIEKKK